jgi:hypothetical protein
MIKTQMKPPPTKAEIWGNTIKYHDPTQKEIEGNKNKE